jgi:hypothetical protein
LNLITSLLLAHTVWGPALDYRTKPCHRPHEIYMMLIWQDGALRSFILSEGYVERCELSNESTALYPVTAAVTMPVSIQSNTYFQHHKFGEDKVTASRVNSEILL